MYVTIIKYIFIKINMENKNTKLFKNQDIWCNINFDEVKNELLTVFKSPNPFQIYLNSKNVLEKFSDFLDCLSKKIVTWFELEDKENNKTFMMTIYKQSNYHKVWIDILEPYLRDSKNFDLLNYLFYVKTLNKDKQYLAKALLKKYLWKSDDEIKAFLYKYNSHVSIDRVNRIFNDYKISQMIFDISLREDFVEHFIEKIYINLSPEKRDLFLDNFILKIDKNSYDFSDISKVLLKVISSYVSWYKKLQMNRVISSSCFTDTKKIVDTFLDDYHSIRSDFYVQLSKILSELNANDRTFFWQYIKLSIIDKYYTEIKYVFYDFSSNQFLDKNAYTLLKWDFKIFPSVSPESEYINLEYQQINDLKEIILELNENLFSFFLLPIVYYSISERLSIQKKDLYKMKYLLLFIFSSNYNEYKKIYMFFNQLEVFMNYDKKTRVFEKIQVSFSIILFVFLSLIISYSYFPIWVFVWILTLSIIKWFEVIYPNGFYKLKWNVWLKFFAVVFLSISSYYWFTNFDKVAWDTANLTNQIKVLWTLSSKEVIDEGFYYIKASILDFNK